VARRTTDERDSAHRLYYWPTGPQDTVAFVPSRSPMKRWSGAPTALRGFHHEFLLTRYVARWFAGNRVDASPARQRIGGLR